MASPSTPQARVLVIDDDPVMRELLCFLLSAEGRTVEAAETGEAALAKLRAGVPDHLPDVLLTDLQLPGLSGAPLAAQLRSAAPDACLLGMSASEPPPETRAAFDAFLLKPFSAADFTAAVELARQTSSPSPDAPPTPASTQPHPACLDEATYTRLAAAIPPPQLAELYQLTLNDIAARIALLREAGAARDLAAYRREAHALKGGCSMVGAVELAELAARGEAGSSGDNPAPEDFAAAAERLRSIMAPRLKLHE